LRECADCPQALEKYGPLPPVFLKAKVENTPGGIVVAAPSRWIAERAKASRVFRNNRVEVIPNGLDAAVFAPRDRRRARLALGVGVNGPVILCGADSLDDPRKGFRFLREAMERVAARLPDALLITFGKVHVPECGFSFRVRNLGRVEGERALARVYSAADVTVIPSPEDNLPNIMLESLACGTPLAGFDTGGIPDSVKDGRTGYLARPGDSRDLADKVLRILETGSISRNDCRDYALRNYAPHVQAKAYVALYRDILENRRTERTPAYRRLTQHIRIREAMTMRTSENSYETDDRLRLPLPNRGKYVIFGAGAAGRDLAAKLPFAVHCFLDNSAERIKEIGGVPVLPPADILKEDDCFIIL
jgi:glycosyltransferase involved in cell wall biosynthesis